MFAMVAASVWSSGSSVWEILSEKHCPFCRCTGGWGDVWMSQEQGFPSVGSTHASKYIIRDGADEEESRSKRADYAGPSPRDGPGCCVGVLWHMGPRSRGEGGGRRRRGRGPMKGAYTAEPVRIHTPY